MLVLGAYRQGEAADAKTYVATVAAILAHYSEDVVRAVTEPASGIQTRIKWLPTPAEVRAACEAELKPQRDYAERKRRVEDERLLLTNTSTASPEERERAFERWMRDIKPELEDAGRAVPKWQPGPIEELVVGSLPKLSEYAKMTHDERAAKILAQSGSV